MKTTCILFLATLLSAQAKLPQMSKPKEWLGYFAGWSTRDFDFGIQAQGEAKISPKDRRSQRDTSKQIDLRYTVQEKSKGRWINKKFDQDNDLTSKFKRSINPEKPLSFITTHTGGTKIEWIHAKNGKSMTITPRVVEKTTANEIRIKIDFRMPRLYWLEDAKEREIRKKLAKDFFKGTRLKDGKNIKFKLRDTDKDPNSDKFFKDGASHLEFTANGFRDRTFILSNGSPKAGRIDIVTKGPLHKYFTLAWTLNMDEHGKNDAHISFTLEK